MAAEPGSVYKILTDMNGSGGTIPDSRQGVPASEPPARVAESLQEIELPLAHSIPFADVQPQRHQFQIGDDLVQLRGDGEGMTRLHR
jgi:hypothetical protein